MIYRFPGSSSGLSFDIFTELVTRMLAFMKAACFLAREASLWAFDDISDSSSLCIHQCSVGGHDCTLVSAGSFFLLNESVS